MSKLLAFLLRVARGPLARLVTGLMLPVLLSLGVDRARLPILLRSIAARIRDAAAVLADHTEAEVEVVEGAVDVIAALLEYFKLSLPVATRAGFLEAIADRVAVIAPPLPPEEEPAEG